MQQDAYSLGFESGIEKAKKDLKPLAEAIQDAIFMFKDIEKARQLPPFAEVQHQYIARGEQLERLFTLSGLKEIL